jgi:hypothetical protein
VDEIGRRRTMANVKTTRRISRIAVMYGRLPAVSFIKDSSACTGRSSDSGGDGRTALPADTINALQQLHHWQSMATVIHLRRLG